MSKPKKKIVRLRKQPSKLERLTAKYAKLTPDEREEVLNLQQRAISRANAVWAVKDREPWSKPQLKKPKGEIQPAPSTGRMFEEPPDPLSLEDAFDAAKVGSELAEPVVKGKLSVSPKSERELKKLLDEVEADLNKAFKKEKESLPPAPPLSPDGDGSEDGEYLNKTLVPAVVGQLLSSKLPEPVMPKVPGTYVVEVGDLGSITEVHLVTPKKVELISDMSKAAAEWCDPGHGDERLDKGPITHVQVIDGVAVEEFTEKEAALAILQGAPGIQPVEGLSAPNWQALPKGPVQPLPRPTPEQYAEKAQRDSEVSLEAMTRKFADVMTEPEPVLVVRESWWERLVNWFRA